MKVKRNTPDLLVAGEIPWFMAIMLTFFILVFVGIGVAILSSGVWAGLIFVVVGGGLGLGAMGVFVERLQLILDAMTKTLTMRSRTIFRYNQTVIPLDDVIRAQTESTLSGTSNQSSTKPRQTLSRLAFVVRDGSGTGGTVVQPMTSVMSSGKASGNVTREVNHWHKALRGTTTLESSPKNLNVRPRPKQKASLIRSEC